MRSGHRCPNEHGQSPVADTPGRTARRHGHRPKDPGGRSPAGRDPQIVTMIDADNGKVIQSFPIPPAWMPTHLSPQRACSSYRQKRA